MKPEEWQRVVELFELVRTLTEDEGERVLASAGRDDPFLVDQVRKLLASDPPADFVVPPHPAHGKARGPDALFGGGLEGTRVGDFVLRRELGRGGMGVVYLADQVDLERRVAVKVLPLAQFGHRDALERFRREAKAASKLEHPHIANILSYGEGESTAWYAMRYVEGHDLFVEIKHQRAVRKGKAATCLLPHFDSPEYLQAVVRLVAQLAEAIQHAHGQGIVHRDVKPQNIILDAGGNGHLVDFGLARDERFGTLSGSRDVRGTPHYMSPEQVLARRAEVDHRTDIYSLGIVLYELLCLRRPFDGGTSAEILSQIVRREHKPVRTLNARVARDLAVICDTCMAKSTAERYPSAKAVAADLARFRRHEAIEARPVPVWRQALRRCRRHRTALLAVASALVALVVGAWLMNALSQPRVRVTITSDATGDQVYLQTIDLVSGRLEDHSLIGETPLRGYSLPPGYYRFTVERPDFGWAEFTRLLIRDGEHYVVEATVRQASAEEPDMVFLPAAEVPVGFETDMFKKYDLRMEYVRSFWIDRYEVSNGEYRAFLDSLDEVERIEYEPEHWRDEWWLANTTPAWDDLPVVDIYYAGAQAYAEWAGKRLPTYHEWERATRGADTRFYPWGDEVEGARERAIYDREAKHSTWWRDYLLQTTSVRSLETADGVLLDDRTELGLLHALGNAQEWTETIEVSWVDGDPHPSLADRVVKGSDWDSDYGGLGLAGVTFQPAALADRVGFRCAKSALVARE